MVLISDKKYACETCIKGHRSSTCKHTDRPLFEIKKKGRPVTQCEHCRELRKTKQVHVKCMCESKDHSAPDTPPSDSPTPPAAGPSSAPVPSASTSTSASTSKKATSKLPPSAAFPHGLPEALEATVASQLLSEGSSDSDPHSSCSCKDGDECICWAPRKPAHKSWRRGSQGSDDTGTSSATAAMRRATLSAHVPPPLSVLARIAELRPVLPRPPPAALPLTEGDAGPLHDPSAGTPHPHVPRHHHVHDGVMFSPYSRAYEHAHADYALFDQSDSASDRTVRAAYDDTGAALQPFFDPAALQDQVAWLPAEGSFPSLCQCGDACSCPGCPQHAGGGLGPGPGALDPALYAQCTNPGACVHCLDCSILSLPADLPPNTAASLYESAQTQTIDEWIRRVAELPTSVAGAQQQQPALDLQTGWSPFQIPSQLAQPDSAERAPGTGGRFSTSGERGDTAFLSPPPALTHSRSAMSSSVPAMSVASQSSAVVASAGVARGGQLRMTPMPVDAAGRRGGAGRGGGRGSPGEGEGDAMQMY